MDNYETVDTYGKTIERMLPGRLSRRAFMGMVTSGALASLMGACAPTAIPTPGPDTPTGSPSTPTPAPSVVTPSPISPTPPPPKVGGILRIAQGQRMPDLDPHKSTMFSSLNFFPALFNSLVRYDREGEIVGDLAESWEWVNPTNLIFVLKKGVLFHNGRECTADDIKFSLERLLDSDTASYWRQFIDELKQIIIEDKYTVEIVTARPSARLLHSLADCMVVARENVDEVAFNPIGTGPFRLKEYTVDQQIETERFGDYFEEGVTKLDGVRIVIYPDGDAAMAAFKSGAVDILWQLPPRSDAEISKSADWEIVKGRLPLYLTICQYDCSSEPFNDNRVRKAFRYATDCDAVRDTAYFGRAQSNWTNNLFPPGHPDCNPNLAKYSFDLEKARQLLDEAGIAEGYRVRTPVISGAVPQLTTTMQIYQSRLAEIGVNLEFDEIEVAAWKDTFERTGVKYPKVFTVQHSVCSVVPHSVLQFIIGNVSNWDRAEEITELAKEAASAVDRKDRTLAYWRIQDIVWHELPFISPVHSFLAHARWNYVKDLYVDWAGNLKYAEVWLDK